MNRLYNDIVVVVPLSASDMIFTLKNIFTALSSRLGKITYFSLTQISTKGIISSIRSILFCSYETKNSRKDLIQCPIILLAILCNVIYESLPLILTELVKLSETHLTTFYNLIYRFMLCYLIISCAIVWVRWRSNWIGLDWPERYIYTI